VGARDAGRGQAAAAGLAAGGADVRFLQLDVTDADSVKKAAA
jgi:NAD(P)-dependent dehydrogenase (short-subunit alcohol dehydrogenase family)